MSSFDIVHIKASRYSKRRKFNTGVAFAGEKTNRKGRKSDESAYENGRRNVDVVVGCGGILRRERFSYRRKIDRYRAPVGGALASLVFYENVYFCNGREIRTKE